MVQFFLFPFLWYYFPLEGLGYWLSGLSPPPFPLPGSSEGDDHPRVFSLSPPRAPAAKKGKFRQETPCGRVFFFSPAGIENVFFFFFPPLH